MLEHTLEQRLEAQARLREISDAAVLLKLNLGSYPANQYLIDRLEAERERIVLDFVYVCYDADAPSSGGSAEEPQT